MVKANQKTLHRQIASQFQGKRTIPFVAKDQEISHGRDITWTLRAKEAPQHIRESWVGTCWILEMNACPASTPLANFIVAGQPLPAPETASRSRRGTFFSQACAPPQKPCCNLCATAGALSAGTGSVTPSSTRTPTATGAMGLVRWPACELQHSTCCGWLVFSRSALGCRR